MKKTILLTESQLISLIDKVINEDIFNWVSTSTYPMDKKTFDDIDILSDKGKKPIKKYPMDTRNKKTEEFKKYIEDLLNQGKTLKEISEITGKSYETLFLFCKRYSIDCTRNKKSEELKKTIENLLNQGKSLKEISEITGKLYGTLYNICKRYKLNCVNFKSIADKSEPNPLKVKVMKDIPREKLEFYLDQGKSIKEIATLFGVSKYDIIKACDKFQINCSQKLNKYIMAQKTGKLTESDLTHIIRRIIKMTI